MLPLFAVSDAVWITLLSVTPPTLASLATLIAVLRSAVAARHTARRADKLAVATHGLVNSGMLTQLKLAATLSRRLYNLTKDPADLAAAELAETLYSNQEARQAGVDAKMEKGRT